MSHLVALVDAAGPGPVVVVGVGNRARRRVHQLADERPNVEVIHTPSSPREWTAFVNRAPNEAVGWYRPDLI